MSESNWKQTGENRYQFVAHSKSDTDSILLKIEVQSGCGPERWLVFADVPGGWIPTQRITAIDVDDAKRQAVEIVKAKLQEAMDALNSAS